MNIEQLIEQANAAVDQQQYAEAVELLKQALVLSPDNIEAMLLLAYSLDWLGLYNDAIKYYKQVLETEPNNRPAKVNIIQDYLNINNVPLALEELNNIRSLNDRDVETNLFMGQINQKFGYYGEAQRYYDKITPTPVENLSICIAVISNLLYLKQYQRAEKLLQTMPSKFSHEPIVSYYLGYFSLPRKDYRKALEYYKTALMVDPDETLYLCAVGNVQLTLRDYQAAKINFAHALSMQSDDIQALNGLATANYRLKNYFEAIPYFQKASEIEPYRSELFACQGRCYFKLGYWRKCIELHKQSFQCVFSKIRLINQMDTQYKKIAMG